MAEAAAAARLAPPPPPPPPPAPAPELNTGLKFARACFAESRLHQRMAWRSLRPLPLAAQRAHRQQIWNVTAALRGLPVRSYRGYDGPWLENRWIDAFSSSPQHLFGGLIPVFAQWFDAYHAHKYAKGKAKGARPRPLRAALLELGGAMRLDAAYVTVSDYDHGLFHFLAPQYDGRLLLPFSQLLVLSSGGVGHVPLPLLKQPEPPLPRRASAAAPVLYFKGSLDGMRPARMAMAQELLHTAALSAAQRAQVRIESLSAPRANRSSAREGVRRHANLSDWREALRRAAFVLTPRGQARNSYFVWETVQMGLLPVYVWDDHEWLPYRGSARADFEQFGFSVRVGTFKARAAAIWAAAGSEAQLAARREKALALRASHFTFEGVLEQIGRLLAHGTSGERGSDLRCLRRAPLGGPQCRSWKDNFFQKGTTDCAPPWYPPEERGGGGGIETPWTEWDASLVHAGFTFKEYTQLIHRSPHCSTSLMLRGCAASLELNASERFPGFFAALIKAGRGDEILNASEDSWR
ncbi:hypothetical protein AB1Y20_011416 [Prymnesium parvum]|uniref:Exostosin GT47 domain-containing protein n=1 Tax=Prymnesium parvum TaxID=97485 RepID=A0AB34IPM3_PRYPA